MEAREKIQNWLETQEGNSFETNWDTHWQADEDGERCHSTKSPDSSSSVRGSQSINDSLFSSQTAEPQTEISSWAPLIDISSERLGVQVSV